MCQYQHDTHQKPGGSSHKIHSHDQKARIRKKQQERGGQAALLLHMEVNMMDARPQSEGFCFYRVPRQLVKGREYRPLSPAGKLLSELERIGLIERKKQGQGKPDRISVLQFCAQTGLLDFPKGNF